MTASARRTRKKLSSSPRHWKSTSPASLNVFNHRTNVDIANRVVCYDIKELGKQLKQLGMLVVQDQVWNRVTRNREAGKTTRYYVDEFHLLLQRRAGRVERGDLEALPQVGRRADGRHAKCERPFWHRPRSRTSSKTRTTSVCSTRLPATGRYSHRS